MDFRNSSQHRKAVNWARKPLPHKFNVKSLPTLRGIFNIWNYWGVDQTSSLLWVMPCHFFFFFPAKRLRSGIIRRTTSLIVIHSAIAAVIPCYHGIDAIYLYLIVSSIHFVKSGHKLTRLESHTPTSAKSLQPTRHLIGRQIAFNFAHRLACKSTHLFSHSAPPSNMCIRVVDLQLTPGKHVVYSSTIYDGIYHPPWGRFPGSIALRPRGRQYRTIRLRKASSRRDDSNAHFFGTDPICGDLDHGKSAQGCVTYII